MQTVHIFVRYIFLLFVQAWGMQAWQTAKGVTSAGLQTTHRERDLSEPGAASRIRTGSDEWRKLVVGRADPQPPGLVSK